MMLMVDDDDDGCGSCSSATLPLKLEISPPRLDSMFKILRKHFD